VNLSIEERRFDGSDSGDKVHRRSDRADTGAFEAALNKLTRAERDTMTGEDGTKSRLRVE